MSEEVKIYRGTVSEIDDPVLLKPFLHFSGRKHYLIIGANHSTVDEKFVSDLTELELHPKGEGVWIEGYSRQQVRDILDFACRNISSGASSVNSPYSKNFQKVIDLYKEVAKPDRPTSAPMDEPKGYETFVIANEKGFYSRYKWQKNIANDLWCSANGDRDVPWSELINPTRVAKDSPND